MISISLFNIGCMDNFNPKIPDHITAEVVVSPIPTPVIIVEHRISISVEMEQMFTDECSKDFDTHSQEFESCMNNKKSEFIKSFMDLINNGGNK